MSTEQEKLNRFAMAVDEEVTTQINEILSQAEANRKEIIDKANDESLYEAYDRIKEEIKKISNKYVKLVAKAELDSKREVLLHREKIACQVIENVKKKLIAFTEKPEYSDYLSGLVSEEKSENGNYSEMTVYLSAKDMKLADEIKKATSTKIKFEIKDSIKIGGLCICYKKDSVLKDKTLDSALDEQKCSFNNSSCLRLS